MHYATLMRNELAGDIWEKLFQRAVQDCGDDHDEISPYWVFQTENGAFIERYIPMLTLSRDIEKSMILKKSLAVYRMVFGQARQEDLLEYIMSHYKEADIDSFYKNFVIDLSPR
jgi:hypothetical protein